MHRPLSANRIIWYEIAAFSLIIALSWANELGDLTQRLLGGSASSEDYVEKNFKTQTSHGMCPACSRKFKEEQEN